MAFQVLDFASLVSKSCAYKKLNYTPTRFFERLESLYISFQNR